MSSYQNPLLVSFVDTCHITKVLNARYIPNTNRIHAIIQISIAVNPSDFGEFVVMLLKILIKTRNTVMSNAIRPKD